MQPRKLLGNGAAETGLLHSPSRKAMASVSMMAMPPLFFTIELLLFFLKHVW